MTDKDVGLTTPLPRAVHQQSRGSTWLLAVCCLALACTARAAPTFRLESSLDNGNWFPVERRIMEEVVSDSAISQLSSDFDFLLVSANDPRAKTAEILRLDVTLIEPAQDIKVVIEAVVEGQTRQAEVVTDIETSDYSSIVRSLARAGRSAASRMSAKLSPGEHAGKFSDEKLIETQRLLNQAAQLKRESKYEQSHAALRLILSQKDLPDKIRKSVKQELHFRLPLYQADAMMQGEALNLTDPRDQPAPAEVRAHYDFIESILKKALNQNLTSTEQQRQLNQRLDRVYQTRQWVLDNLQTNARARLGGLKASVAEAVNSRGSLSEKGFKEVVGYTRVEVQVHDFDSSGRGFKALVETENGYHFHVRYDPEAGPYNKVSIEAAQPDG